MRLRFAASALLALVAAAPGACTAAPADGGRDGVPAGEPSPVDGGEAVPAPGGEDTPPPPAGPTDVAEARPMNDPTVLLVATARGPVPIGGPRTLVALEAAAGAERAAADLAAGRPPDGEPALLVHDLRAEAPPGVLFDLYLVGGEGEPPGHGDPRHLGSINFYGADPVRPGFQRFELAAALAELRRRGELSGDGLPSLLLVPQGGVETGSAPALGRVELVVDR